MQYTKPDPIGPPSVHRSPNIRQPGILDRLLILYSEISGEEMIPFSRLKKQLLGMQWFFLIYLIICGIMWPFLGSMATFSVGVLSDVVIIRDHVKNVSSMSNGFVVFLLGVTATTIHLARLVYYRRKKSDDYRTLRLKIQNNPVGFKSDWARIAIWFVLILLFAFVATVWIIGKPRIIADSAFSFSICTLIVFYIVGGVLDFLKYLPLLGR